MPLERHVLCSIIKSNSFEVMFYTLYTAKSETCVEPFVVYQEKTALFSINSKHIAYLYNGSRTNPEVSCFLLFFLSCSTEINYSCCLACFKQGTFKSKNSPKHDI